MLQRRLIVEWWAILLFACILAFFAANNNWTQRLDNLILDYAIPIAAAAPADDILVVEIDERSLAETGSWPWPRTVHAKLIEKISAGKPRAIGYDVLFIEPGDGEDDQALAGAVAAAANVILPFQYQVPGSNGREIDQFLPFPPLSQVAAGLGHVGLRFDSDGLIRRVALRGPEYRSEMPFEHLTEVMYAMGRSNAQSNNLSVRPAGDVLLPLNPRASFRTIPASSFLRNEVPSNFVQGKYVLVGASAQGMVDVFPVAASVGSSMPGVEIQANLLNGLIANKFVREAKPWVSFLIAALAIIALMLAFWRLSPRANLILSIVILCTLLLGAPLVTILSDVWIAPGPAVLPMLLLYPLWGWRRLAALNDFVASQTSRLSPSVGQVGNKASLGLDAVANQAMRLRSLIGELADREEFVKDVIGAAPDAICVISGTDKIILANSKAEALFGVDLVGQSLALKMGLEVGRLPSDGSEWCHNQSSKIMLVTSSMMAESRDDQSVYIFCLSDITAIREAERERKEMLEFLSHDMRSPQVAIVSLIDNVGESDWRASEALPRIKKHAMETLKLNEDFVQLARLESAALRLDEHNVTQLLAEAIDQNFTQARLKSMTITLDGNDEFLYVSVDGATIVRAFANLIGNAIKYGPAGSTISCRFWEQAEPIRLLSRAYCEIADQGPGMPPERASDPFHRFGYRDESGATGAGLGLAFVKRAIDKNNGDISCYSKPLEGTKFVISFPALDAIEE